MDLLDILRADGIEAKKVSGRDGGEYVSPCPACGGTDRFRVWPGRGGRDGSYWCRQCKIQGDVIQYLKDFRALSYADACRVLGIEPAPKYATGHNHPTQRRTTPSPRPAASPAWTPKETTAPPDAWQTKAVAMAEWAEQQLWGDACANMRAWLAEQRLLTDGTIKSARLGWIPGDMYRDRTAWGLSAEAKDNGAIKRLWLPAGLVIPCYNKDGRIVRLRVRRARPDGPRYCTISGSSACPMVCGSGRRAVMVVESDLDALLIHQDAGDLVAVVAMGSAQMRPDAATTEMLRRAETVLVSLDGDEAGAREAWGWWMEHFRNARRWPCIEGKDPTEMARAGIPVRTWVEAALLPDADGGPQPGETGAEETDGGEGTPEQQACQSQHAPQAPPCPAQVRCYDCGHFIPGRFLKLPGTCAGTPHDGNLTQSALDLHPCAGFRLKGDI